MISTVQTNELFETRQNLLSQLAEQDYNVGEYSNFSANEVNIMKQNNQLDMLLESPKRKMYVRYCLHIKKLSQSNVYEIVDDLFDVTQTLTKNDTLYIIATTPPNETMQNELVNLWEQRGIFVIIEGIDWLKINILKHEKVPKHTIISDERVAELREKFNITSMDQFPEISRFDPVARAIGIRLGEVCHIARPSKTAIVTDYYRLCVNEVIV